MRRFVLAGAVRLVACVAGGASLLLLAATACSPSPGGPKVGGQTNWLSGCESAEDCDGFECVCGVCTALCGGSDSCADLAGANCFDGSAQGAQALCAGETPSAGVCLPACDATCDDGFSCVAGACVPADPTTIRLAVDTMAARETLLGFGASLAYAEDAIVASPVKEALYDLLFTDAGLDLLRLRNRYADGATPNLDAASEIVAAASTRLGRPPVLFLTSGGAPAALKASGELLCAGDAITCTLATVAGGGFDYAGFAGYWRASLQGYAAVGLVPDYVGIQNDPDWLPDADRPHEGCRFLPTEGTTTVQVDGADMDVAYPGYREALTAVRAATADLAAPPAFLAPEASALGLLGAYLDALDAEQLDAVAVHLYDVDPAAPDRDAFAAAGDAARQVQLPLLQTEMQAGGLETAVLIHHAVVDAGATAYLQNDTVSLDSDDAAVALALLEADVLSAQEPHYALLHFARYTDPGWVRVDVGADQDGVLASAWRSPDGAALTVVLINPGVEPRDVRVLLPADVRARAAQSELVRTAFGGTERAASVGQLPASGLVTLPARAIVTVALTE